MGQSSPYGAGFLTDLAPLFHLLILIGAPILLMARGPWKGAVSRLFTGTSSPLRRFFYGVDDAAPAQADQPKRAACPQHGRVAGHGGTAAVVNSTALTQPQLGRGAGDSAGQASTSAQTGAGALLPGEENAEISHFDPDFYSRNNT
jgi:hypothetical protein